MAIRVIVLDFDGVVVESNNIKHQAFSELFSVFPDYHEEIMVYHLAHNAVNRHDKFRYIMENILKRKYDKKLAEKWATRFSKLTRDSIINCPYVAGAMEFIRCFYDKYPVYLASATPLDELKIILRRRGILKYFKHVYGAPASKIEMFKDIKKKEKVKPDEILYIGDSREDYDAGSEFGCVFIARTGSYDFEGLGIKSFKNMFEITSFVLNYIIEGGVENGLPDRTVQD